MNLSSAISQSGKTYIKKNYLPKINGVTVNSIWYDCTHNQISYIIEATNKIETKNLKRIIPYELVKLFGIRNVGATSRFIKKIVFKSEKNFDDNDNGWIIKVCCGSDVYNHMFFFQKNDDFYHKNPDCYAIKNILYGQNILNIFAKDFIIL